MKCICAPVLSAPGAFDDDALYSAIAVITVRVIRSMN